jgi:hypothetical protein
MPLTLEALEARNLLSTSSAHPITNGASGDFIYWIDFSSGDIRRANLDGSGQQTLVTGLFEPIGIALDLGAGKMYWTDYGTNDIRRANLDGSGQQTLVTGLSGPEGIALDLAAGQMYWTDYQNPGDIRRANLDGSGQQTLVTGLNYPNSVALDLGSGQMYWTDYGSGDIRRANLDGSGQETLVTGQRPTGIALDVSRGQMYWSGGIANISGDIRRANLDGSDQQILVSAGRVLPDVALDLAAGQMYWTDEYGGQIRRGNLDGSDQQTLVTGLSFPFGIALQLEAAPTVTCSVADPLLWPPNHQLVNVGLSVDVQPPDATLQVQVYANDNANASDAADIGPDTLQLRAERQGNSDGRVYLIVATATDASGQTGFDVCTVVVAHDQSGGSIAKVQAEAAAAEAYYREFQAAPAGYALLGEGPAGADGNDARNGTVAVVGLGPAFSTSEGAPAVLAGTVTATVPPTGPVSLEVQPDYPTLAQTVPAPLPAWDARQTQDAVFQAWDEVIDGLAGKGELVD